MVNTIRPSVPYPPRAVPRGFYRRRMRTMWLLGLVFTLVGVPLGAGMVLLFFVLGNHPLADLRLDRRHVVADATLREKEEVTSVHVNGKHPWRLAFEFTTPDGRRFSASGYTYDEKIAQREPGDAFPIEYDPERPGLARPVGGYVSISPPWIMLIIAASVLPETLLGLGLLVTVRILAARERRLLRDGDAVAAEVVSVTPVGAINMGSRHPYDVRYRFRDMEGRETTGRDRTYHYEWAERLRPGDSVPVIYDPFNPQRNVLWLHGPDASRL